MGRGRYVAVPDLGVTNFGDGGANHLLVVEFSARGDFTTESDKIVFHHGLAGHSAAGVLLETGVENRVGDGVTHLVGVAFGDGLG